MSAILASDGRFGAGVANPYLPWISKVLRELSQRPESQGTDAVNSKWLAAHAGPDSLQEEGKR
jgi:hypothetical protein